MTNTEIKKVNVKLVKSLIGSTPIQRKTARAMGLRKVGAHRIHQLNPVTQGMITKIKHLVIVTAMEN
jgi:large subunit ribosomal protein L30